MFLIKKFNTRLVFLILTPIGCIFLFSIAFIGTTNFSQTFLESEQTDFDISGGVPGEYVKYIHPTPSNDSYCHFNFNLPELFLYDERDLQYTPELGEDSTYRVIYNVIQAKVTEEIPAVTYATHISVNFANYIAELVRFWDGPVSVTAFVPYTDLPLLLEQFVKYCYCIPNMSRVSLHLVFPINSTVSSPEFGGDVALSKPTNCVLVDSLTVKSYRMVSKDAFIYPVNVCRNVARAGAMTKYFMVSDVELMPSQDLASGFRKMIKTQNIEESSSKTVYVVPIFEVEDTEPMPRTKRQLIELIGKDKAVYFHRVICVHCQKFPKIEEWLSTDPGNEVSEFTSTKREVPYNRWEPIYIGTKDEPLYSEHLSWEGLQDKMLQMLEMCLIRYEFVVLDGAFLVHWPGIKKIKQNEQWRSKFVKTNSIIYDRILRNLSQKYDHNPNCKLK